MADSDHRETVWSCDFDLYYMAGQAEGGGQQKVCLQSQRSTSVKNGPFSLGGEIEKQVSTMK